MEAVKRQTNVVSTKGEKVVDKALRSVYFKDLEEIGEAYELESRKLRVAINRAFQVGIAVYQLAKVADVGVLLGLSGPVRCLSRLRADSDGHR